MASLPALSCRRVQLALNPPLGNARHFWHERSSIRIRVRDAAGREGQGEVAPLPGYSPDRLEDAEQALAALPPLQLAELTELTSPAELLEAVGVLVPAELPAVRFGLETALLDRLGRCVERPVWSLLREVLGAQLGVSVPAAVGLTALLPSGSPAEALAAAHRLVAIGVRSFKVKIGPDQLQPSQQALLDALRSQLGAACSLRLDANRSLDRAGLPGTWRRLVEYQPEFVEEPLAEPDAVELAASPCAWALDESLERIEPARLAELLALSTCGALVLKPTSLGGYARCAALFSSACAFGRASVVSHTFEGPVGWLACAHLAVALGSALPAGLWPARHQTRGLAAWIRGGRLQPLERPGLGLEP